MVEWSERSKRDVARARSPILHENGTDCYKNPLFPAGLPGENDQTGAGLGIAQDEGEGLGAEAGRLGNVVGVDTDFVAAGLLGVELDELDVVKAVGLP